MNRKEYEHSKKIEKTIEKNNEHEVVEYD